MFRILIILLFIIAPTICSAQRDRPKNLDGKFEAETRRFHFGFHLGYNSSFYALRTNSYDSLKNGLVAITPGRSPGFLLAPIAVWHANKNWKVRLIPLQLSFEDRRLIYKYRQTDGTFDNLEQRVQSTYLQFPIGIKYRTDRVNNAAFYLIGAGQYGIDLQSNKKVINSNQPFDVLKANPHAWEGYVGGGIDFFLQYFKFAVEVTYTHGFNNMLIQDNSYYSTPLQGLYNRSWVIKITFEG